MTYLEELHAQLVKDDPEYEKAWEDYQPELDLQRQIIQARIDKNMTQEEFANSCGIEQSSLSRIETGRSNPTLETLVALARGMGKKLKLTFMQVNLSSRAYYRSIGKQYYGSMGR